jgi:hypothetical protein
MIGRLSRLPVFGARTFPPVITTFMALALKEKKCFVCLMVSGCWSALRIARNGHGQLILRSAYR